ncbi:serine/threonine-protein kinase [Paenibacillus sp. GP183]|uniref:serine/threonine protein kinase n=1 Tax=Paenibacillus sp. GP183 TaxID=1882751 RepID=UPI000898C552|nr:serine/threonine-protein kinase [Paenibacillus sp. GP183]SED14705.1 serine/threonine protein kinase [Paenibacillus sp. GP183]
MQLSKVPEEDLTKKLTDLREIEFLTFGGQKLVYTCLYEGTKCALKLIPLFEEYGEQVETDITRRAEREIKVMREMTSPFFIKLGTTEPGVISINGRKYYHFTESFIDGTPLDGFLRQRTLEVNECVKVGLQITSTISEFVERKYIHRDIKPNNIMYKNTGDFLLLDAGIAYDQGDASSITKGPIQPGTRIYSSPEQLIETGREIDFRSDLFSLGIVLYESLTNRHPFILPGTGETHIIFSILKSPHAPISTCRSDIPKRLVTLINRLLAKRPHMRYKSCDLLMKELNQIKEEL